MVNRPRKPLRRLPEHVTSLQMVFAEVEISNLLLADVGFKNGLHEISGLLENLAATHPVLKMGRHQRSVFGF